MGPLSRRFGLTGPSPFVAGARKCGRTAILLLSAWLFAPATIFCEPALPPDGIHVLDGSCVLDVGELRVNITNFGLIGSQYSANRTYSDAASGEWPGGSGDEYLWGAGLWIGGKLAGQISVTTGQPEQELRPASRLVDTIYEARDGYEVRPGEKPYPTGRRLPTPGADDDGDGRYDEDMLNGIDDDLDGRVDEDFGQLGDQMFTCTMFDNGRLVQELYPEHEPLNLKVVQRAIAYDRGARESIVGLDFDITNVGHREITEMYLGFYVDCDIQSRSDGSAQPDDLAGSFSGFARADDGWFYRIEIAYMWDGAIDDPLPGYFGAQLLHHPTAFDGVTAPFRPLITSFNIFSTRASVIQDGEPFSDLDRYYVMSRPTKDRNMRPEERTDIKMLMASGPFGPLRIGHSLDYNLALVIGEGMQGMLETAIEAAKLYAGNWYDDDNDWTTGQAGRETYVCLGDYPAPLYGDDPIYGHRLDFMDDSCTGGYPVMFREVVSDENLVRDEDYRYCVWVNMDNCTECMAANGAECDDRMFFGTRYRHRFTGVWGREKHYPWTLAQDEPPAVPGSRVMPGDNRVEILWDDRSEIVPDPTLGVIDFESYRIWRVDDWVPPGGMSEEAAPPADAWALVAEYDIVNEVPAGVGTSPRATPLGRNTGLEIAAYEPACLRDSRFGGLAAAMQELVDSDIHGHWIARPPVRGHDGSVNEGMEPFVRWESWPAVLDTFFAVTGREADADAGIVGKHAVHYYHHVDDQAHNGFQSYYAVVARDHQLYWTGNEYVPAGFGLEADPTGNYHLALARPDAQSVRERAAKGANIYVYPDPATREALEEFQSREPSAKNPTGVHVTFNNLPLAHNTIRIFTIAGDLLQTIEHDGFSEGGSAVWNLMTRNGQEIVSGVYLFSVHSSEEGFEPFRGRFVVIR